MPLQDRSQQLEEAVKVLGLEGDTIGDKVHTDLGVGLGRGQQTAAGRAPPSPSAEPLSITLMDALDLGGLIGLSGFFHFTLLFVFNGGPILPPKNLLLPGGSCQHQSFLHTEDEGGPRM